MVVEKGLEPAVADRIGEYVKLSGQGDLLEKLGSDNRLVRLAGILHLQPKQFFPELQYTILLWT